MKRINNELFKILLLIMFIIFSTTYVNAQEKKKILYISSGSPTYTSTQEQMYGFDDLLRNDYEIYYEYMNTFKYPEKKLEESFYSLLSYKLKVYPKFDAVVFVDDSASAFALKHTELFGDSKLFLSSIFDDKIIEGAKNKNIECIIKEFKPISSNVEIIGKIYKNSEYKKKLTLITGPEDIYKNEINEFYSLQDKYPKLKFENKTVGFKSEEEIKEVFSKFSKREDIVLFYNSNSSTSSKIVKDTSTTLGSVRQILSAIEGTTEAPIFTTTNLGIEYGMMGGYTIDFYKQGSVTGDIVRNFLEGNKNYPEILEGERTSTLIFNQRHLTNNLISKKQIPQDSEIFYESEEFFKTYKNEIILILIIFVILCFIIIFLISEQSIFKRANKKLKESKKIAEDANRAKSNFIANISHELRTPVNVISSSSQLIKRNLEIKDEIDKENLISNINMIDKNSHRLIRLINNIIDVTKSDTGYKNINLKNVEVISLIENTVQSVIPLAESKNLNIILDTEVEELIMAIDIDKIERIMLNLISNAIKFSFDKGTIFTYISVEDDNLIISVKDEGIGIKEESLCKIFDKFVQIDNGFTRLNEGSGLGLSLVKSFVNLHEGSIDVKSSECKGTTFVVKLPIKVLDSSEVIYNAGIDNKNTIVELSDIYI